MFLLCVLHLVFFFFSSRRRHTRLQGDWSSDVCSSDLKHMLAVEACVRAYARKAGADEEVWGIAALLHDFDYERWPNQEHRSEERRVGKECRSRWSPYH